MVKVEVKIGDWEKSVKNTIIFRERCPKCGQRYVYPKWYGNPSCPDDGALLHGAMLCSSLANRIYYHIGEEAYYDGRQI